MTVQVSMGLAGAGSEAGKDEVTAGLRLWKSSTVRPISRARSTTSEYAPKRWPKRPRPDTRQ
jgi:hypothetical protein